jgi:hypothetical protein
VNFRLPFRDPRLLLTEYDDWLEPKPEAGGELEGEREAGQGSTTRDARPRD